MDQEQISLNLSENMTHAIDYAFKEAQQYLTSGIGIAPFTVTIVDGGFEVDDHSGNAEDDVYESVKMQLAQDMPEGYVLCYDGYADTDDGRRDAIIVEACERGDVTAYALALLYTLDAGEYTFEAGYGYAGLKPQLYPAGTKPVVSGMSALSEEDKAAMRAEREAKRSEAQAQPEEGATEDAADEPAAAGDRPEAAASDGAGQADAGEDAR